MFGRKMSRILQTPIPSPIIFERSDSLDELDLILDQICADPDMTLDSLDIRPAANDSPPCDPTAAGHQQIFIIPHDAGEQSDNGALPSLHQKLDRMLLMLTDVQRAQAAICKRIERLERPAKRLRKREPEPIAPTPDSSASIRRHPPVKLPFMRVPDVLAFNTMLQDDEMYQQQMTVHLNELLCETPVTLRRYPESVNTRVRRIIELLMTYETSGHFSWSGCSSLNLTSKTKVPFREQDGIVALIKLVAVYPMPMPDGSEERRIVLSIKEYFKRSSLRRDQVKAKA